MTVILSQRARDVFCAIQTLVTVFACELQSALHVYTRRPFSVFYGVLSILHQASTQHSPLDCLQLKFAESGWQ